MYKFLVTFDMKPGMLPKLLAAAQPVIDATRKEPGCISYEFFPSFDRKDSFVAVECFRSRADHAAHEATPHFLAFKPVMQSAINGYKIEVIEDSAGK